MAGLQLPEVKLCPACSIFKRRHSELPGDIIHRPTIITGRHSGKFFLTGCRHAEALKGPHEDDIDLEFSWNQIAAQLRTTITPERLEDATLYEQREAEIFAKRQQQLTLTT